MEKNRIKSIMESLLFVVEKPITIEKFYDIFDREHDRKQLSSVLEELRNDLDSSNARGIKLERIADGWQLRTKEDNQNWIKKLESIKPIRISHAALEVLAIIAYKQPVTRSTTDKIRGVDSSHIFRTLMERNLIKISAKADLPGKPLLYSTTPEFLEVFGLNNLSNLPSHAQIQELASKSTGDSGDFKVDLEPSLRSIVEQNENISQDINITQDSNAQEILDKMTQIGKDLKIDIDLVQEKVDIIFEEACRKHAADRKDKS